MQINNSFSGQSYLPYSVGILQAYAQKHLSDPGNYDFLVPVYKRIPVGEAVEQLMSADVVGFSMYVWNAEISLRIAELLKARKPEVLIVFGGPHVPNNKEEGMVVLGGQRRPNPTSRFLEKYPFIDVVVHGEGEKPFVSILENIQDWKNAPSLSYLNNGVLVNTSKVVRMRDLDEVPSPYLEGTFDELMAQNPFEEWIVVWETDRGCPFSCSFCDWGSNTLAKIGIWGIERLYQEIDWFAARKISYVFNADANFGILARDLDVAVRCVEVKEKTGFPSRLSVQNMKSTTRDAMEKSWRVQKVLSDGKLNQGVVVSMQSLNPETLKAIKRDNMKLEFFHEIQSRFTQGGVETMSDLILGMPEETYESFANGVSALIEGGQHNRIQFNNLSILPNAEMGNPTYQERYGMETVVSRVVNIHGSKSEEDAVPEFQQLVIATASMPRPEWVRARVFAWMAGFLHFDKVLQIPLVLVKENLHASYRELIELFSEAAFSREEFPALHELKDFFTEAAVDIQQGSEEYRHSSEWLDIWWPADEYALIRLVTQGKIGAFYDEALKVLSAFAYCGDPRFPLEALGNAVKLNRELIKLPFQHHDLLVDLAWNVSEFHQSVRRGEPIPLARIGSRTYRIDRTSERWDTWNDWYQKVVWWGNKRGAYLYGNTPEEQLAGHF